jgi:hypothetical protein
MFRKMSSGQSATLILAMLVTLVMWVSVTDAAVFEADVVITDAFSIAPPDLSGTFSLGGDGLMGGVASTPGGLQAFGTPSFGAAFPLLGALPSAWPTADPITFAGAFEFEVAGVSGDPSSILAGDPQYVSGKSSFTASVPGIATIVVDKAAFRLHHLSLLSIPASGWAPGTGSIKGTIDFDDPAVPDVPFNEAFDGWGTGFLADGTLFGALGIITTKPIPAIAPFGDVAAFITGGTATLHAATVPEPSTFLLLGLGGLGWLGYIWRRKRAA